MRQIVLLMIIVAAAHSQDPSTIGGAGLTMSTHSNKSATAFTYHFPKSITVLEFTNAPYAGRIGNPQTADRPMTWRDTMGRTRVDGSLPEITDPVAGYGYVLDPVHHIAHRIAIQARQNQPPDPTSLAGAVRNMQQSSRTTEIGINIRNESLGTQTMFGIPVTGHRTTTTYPNGTYQGNDHPVTVVNESWSSDQYGLVLRKSETGPNGDATVTMKDFTTAEPDPSLFVVPAGYRTVDETREFTITIPRAQ